MTDRPVEPTIAVEIDRTRDAVLQLMRARRRFQELRAGKSDLPVFPVVENECR